MNRKDQPRLAENLSNNIGMKSILKNSFAGTNTEEEFYGSVDFGETSANSLSPPPHNAANRPVPNRKVHENGGAGVRIAEPQDNEEDTGNSQRRNRANGEAAEEADEKDGKRKKVDKKALCHLRLFLKLFFYNAFKWKGDTCSFHLINCAVFLLQILKVTLITIQLFQFGNERRAFNEIVDRGHTTLRYLLLLNWDPAWESLPYPPSRGEFASYSRSDLDERINTAVARFYNIEQYAIGYFTRLPGDDISATLKLFDLDGFNGHKYDSERGVSITEVTLPIEEKWLTKTAEPGASREQYSFDVDEFFRNHSIDQPISRLLKLTLTFNLHSVRIIEEDEEALCLNVQGWITYKDLDNNGQVVVDLETLTSKINCDLLNFRVTDWNLRRASESLAAVVTFFCLVGILVTVLDVAFGIYVLLLTKRFMKSNFEAYYEPADETETDLHWLEYTSFFRFWDVTSFIADVLTLYGTIWLGFRIEREGINVADFDIYTVWLSVGGLLTWFSLLRFLNVHNKFNLLFNTMSRAIFDVAAYIVCAGVLFIGFWVCGYVVLGPYHVKFSTPEKASETLVSIIHGDEMYATLNLLEVQKTGDFLIYWFSRFYLWMYIAIYTIVVINLLVAIFMSAYDTIKEDYEQKEKDRDVGRVERAIRKFIECNTENVFRKSIYSMLSGENKITEEEKSLKDVLLTICRVSKQKQDIILVRQRTLKAIMEEEEDLTDFHCLCMTCSFLLLFKKKE